MCEIREGKTRASDLPMITVLLGPMERAEDGQQQQCFFSLNNRRLFVFKVGAVLGHALLDHAVLSCAVLCCAVSRQRSEGMEYLSLSCGSKTQIVPASHTLLSSLKMGGGRL